MIDASVAIVSYNVRALLRRCLESLRRVAPPWVSEVIVVDNGSDDGTTEMVCREFPGVVVIANQTNRGFGAANNQAAAVASGRALLFLNPDTELEPFALETMLDYLEANAAVGVVGPRLSFPDGSLQPSRRRFPTPVTALVESTRIQRWWPTCPVLSRYYVADRSDDEPQEVDWLHGPCLLVRHSAFDAVGGFDERFFMYSEEVDLCRRLREHDWRVVYLPSAHVVHHEGKSSEQHLASRAQRFNESKCRYIEKYFGPEVGRALRLFLLANTVLDLAEEAVKLGLGHRPQLRQQRVRDLARVAWYQWQRLGGQSTREGLCASH